MRRISIYSRASSDNGKQDAQRQVDGLREHSLKMGYVVNSEENLSSKFLI